MSTIAIRAKIENISLPPVGSSNLTPPAKQDESGLVRLSPFARRWAAFGMTRNHQPSQFHRSEPMDISTSQIAHEPHN
jgi:hypothetical protein